MKRFTGTRLCLVVGCLTLVFSISAATQTDIVGLVVDQSGRVGIGTTTPTAGLEINKGDTNDLALRLRSSGAGWGSGIQFVNGSPSKGRTYGIYSGDDGAFRLADEVSRVDRLVVDSTGDTVVPGRLGVGSVGPALTAGLEINKGFTNDLALKLKSSGPGWGSGMQFENGAGKTYGIYAGSDGIWRVVDVAADYDLLKVDSAGTSVTGGLWVAGNTGVGGTLAVANVPHADKQNLQRDSKTGVIYYDNSSRRDKRNVRPLEDDFNRLLLAAPKTYTRPADPQTWEIGYIAEDFQRLGLGRLLRYDEAGRPDSINYTKMGLFVVEILKQHDARMKSYERERGRLEAEVRRLRAQVEELGARRSPK